MEKRLLNVALQAYTMKSKEISKLLRNREYVENLDMKTGLYFISIYFKNRKRERDFKLHDCNQINFNQFCNEFNEFCKEEEERQQLIIQYGEESIEYKLYSAFNNDSLNTTTENVAKEKFTILHDILKTSKTKTGETVWKK